MHIPPFPILWAIRQNSPVELVFGRPHPASLAALASHRAPGTPSPLHGTAGPLHVSTRVLCPNPALLPVPITLTSHHSQSGSSFMHSIPIIEGVVPLSPPRPQEKSKTLQTSNRTLPPASWGRAPSVEPECQGLNSESAFVGREM